MTLRSSLLSREKKPVFGALFSPYFPPTRFALGKGYRAKRDQGRTGAHRPWAENGKGESRLRPKACRREIIIPSYPLLFSLPPPLPAIQPRCPWTLLFMVGSVAHSGGGHRGRLRLVK